MLWVKFPVNTVWGTKFVEVGQSCAFCIETQVGSVSFVAKLPDRNT